MLIDVYDLTGKTQRSQYIGADAGGMSLVECLPLRDLLIEPKRGENRLPYLQDPCCPNLEDFWDARTQTYNFSNAHSLSAILKNLSEKSDIPTKDRYAKLLNDYFNALRGVAAFDDRVEKHIIAVPDNYDANTQEFVLRNSLPRNNTMLLWRSVAAVLGAEGRILSKGVKSGDKVAIVDCQHRYVDVSILELEIEHGHIVPVRQSYRRGMLGTLNTARYPLHMETRKTKAAMHAQSCLMIQASFRSVKRQLLPVWYEDGAAWLPDNTRDVLLKSVKTASGDMVDFNRLLSEADCCIVCSCLPFSDGLASQMKLPDAIFERENESFVQAGAAEYAIRLENDLPTYYDECESLSIVGENVKTETVEAFTLIEPNTRCAGGKMIRGKDYVKCSISATRSFVEFFLLVGPHSQRQVKLKSFRQEFPLTRYAQPLVLKPSMVPGQGVVQVEVHGKPLLDKPIQLDLLENMVESEFSIEKLEERMDRSFPPDVPDVIASEKKWLSVEADVIRWLHNDRAPLDSGWFAKSFPATDSEWRDIKTKYQLDDWSRVFVRTNVFGTERGGVKPSYMSDSVFEELMSKLGRVAQRSVYRSIVVNDDIVRLIAWSYQKNNENFSSIKKHVLNDAVQALESGKGIGQQYKTFCANMLCVDDDFWRFSKAYNKLLETKIAATPTFTFGDQNYYGCWVSGVDDWNRAMSNMLMTNNNMLEFSSMPDNEADDLCEKIVRNIIKIAMSYVFPDSTGKYKRPVFIRRCLAIVLFMLRRRKFQKVNNFIRLQETGIDGEVHNVHPQRLLFGELASNVKTMYKDNANLCELVDVIEKFLDGNGSTGILVTVKDLSSDAYGQND